MADDDDDFEEWAERLQAWCRLSDEERDTKCRFATLQFQRFVNSMTTAQYTSFIRGRLVASCLRWRRLLQKLGPPVFAANLRDTQLELVKLREWRRTGIRPGSA